MKTRFHLPAIMLIAVLAMLVAGCSKDTSDNTTSNDEIAKLFATADGVIEDDALFVDDDLMNLSGLKSVEAGKHPFAPCAAITTDSLNGMKVRTIDFGNVNCLCNDGKIRRGKIIIMITGRRLQTGSVRTTTYENYFVNDNQVSGTATVACNGKNDAGHFNWTITVDKTITYITGQSARLTATRNREWVAGADTPMAWTDDAFLITGTTAFTRTDGFSRNCTIVTPLRKELNCHHFVSGTVKIVKENTPEILLDYGTGECDDIATITVNGETRTIRI